MLGLEIVIRDVFKVYRVGKVEVQALRGLSMEVRDGEIVSIIGPSGSGKTTLLNLIGGLDQPTAGSVRVGKIEVSALSPRQLTDYRRKTVGYIFQNLNLIPTLTAAENIELPMIALGTPRGKRRKRVKVLLEAVGMLHRASHKPDELSGGEQQRVAIAVALANDPPVILADEPTGELDSVNANLVTRYLVDVSREFEKTLIMVTHDSNVARAADRIMRIEDGVIKESLEPLRLAETVKPPSYIEQIRARLSSIDTQLRELDMEFRTGRIDGDEYVKRRLRLKNLRSSLEDELQRMGTL
ncbi:MAG: ABC transporter-like protein [Candidatus Bathyarchaeota archaeon B26-1]|nr:MAG: ABC transporter-like protein [Candidatus Bathyarchaeota archaeon B26-1]